MPIRMIDRATLCHIYIQIFKAGAAGTAFLPRGSKLAGYDQAGQSLGATEGVHRFGVLLVADLGRPHMNRRDVSALL